MPSDTTSDSALHRARERLALVDRDQLRQDVTKLAAIDRPSASEGEREAAEWICGQLELLGVPARVEAEQAHGSYAIPLGALSAAASLAGLAGLRGRRWAALAGGALAGAGIADDISNGARPFRRALMRRRPTWNVVGEAGDRGASRTLVVLAHHDAARSGLIFHPWPQRRLGELFPTLVARTDTSLPLWFPVVAGPGLVALGAVARRRAALALGALLAAGSAAAFADIARRPVVPGANDNLSGVAGLLAVARALRARPLEGLRVLLVSCGSEETFQEGVRAFGARHFPSLPADRTWFLNLETVGSPELVLLEGEGTLVMEDYPEPFKAEVCEAAASAGIHLRRGSRARVSTDGMWPKRKGYPVATLVSLTAWKALANYHWPTDVPENVDYGTVARAATVAEAVARRLAGAGEVAPA